jgi:hypothetical protein
MGKVNNSRNLAWSTLGQRCIATMARPEPRLR